ncbi:hypothetical protein ABZT51_42340 [Streptomyces sp. NPDC005373]|uniref:hypothetical protein n=1 Tax=Streptomyces sp. NPDC005373 TaxID=3156879 RepID=UPI0033A2FD63
MTGTKKPPLTKAYWTAFMSEIHKNAELRLKVIQGIQSSGFYHTLTDHFTLSDVQDELMSAVANGPGGSVWNMLLSQSLLTGGTVTLGSTEQGTNITAEYSGTSLDVFASCSCDVEW